MKKIYYSALLLGLIGLSAYAEQYLKVTTKDGDVTYFETNSEEITYTPTTVTIEGVTFDLADLSSMEVVTTKPSGDTPGDNPNETPGGDDNNGDDNNGDNNNGDDNNGDDNNGDDNNGDDNNGDDNNGDDNNGDDNNGDDNNGDDNNGGETPENPDETEVDPGTVLVIYNGSTASVTVASDITKYVTPEIDGANVVINQTSTSDDNPGEITYILKGSSSNGSFTQNGEYKSTIELQGLNLTSQSGAAIDIQNGKRIELSSKNGTDNILVDSEGGKQKAALYCKGHLELKGKGTLTVTGKTAHAISAKEYIEVKNVTINILGSVKDALNCNQYFLMDSGVINVVKTGDDGIQVSYKDDEGNRDEEDTSTFTLNGGTITIADITNAASKGIKSDNAIVINGGDVTIKSTADGIWDEEKVKTKASSCFSADGDFSINGGNLNLTATGGGGKCISCDGTFTAKGGDVVGLTTGGALVYSNGTLNQNYTGNLDNINSDYKSSPKAIKADTEAYFLGGNFDLTTKGTNGEGIESKGDLTFDEESSSTPLVVKVRAYDDGTNSSNHTYIKGGTLDIISTNAGDGIDANANIYISGGKIIAFGSGGAEQGLDTESLLSITGGYVLSYGGRSNPSPSSDSQPYLSPSLTLAAGNVVNVSYNNEVLGSFTIPSDYTGLGSGGNMPFMLPFQGAPGGPGGNMGPGSGSGTLMISVPGLVSGNSYTVSVEGGSSTTATAQTGNGSTGGGNRPGF